MYSLFYTNEDAGKVVRGVINPSCDVYKGGHRLGRIDRVERPGALGRAGGQPEEDYHWVPSWIGWAVPLEVDLRPPGLCLRVGGLRLEHGQLSAAYVYLSLDGRGVVVPPSYRLPVNERDGWLTSGGVSVRTQVQSLSGDTFWVSDHHPGRIGVGDRVELTPGLATQDAAMRQVSSRRSTVSIPPVGFEMEVLQVEASQLQLRPVRADPALTNWLMMLYGVLTVRCKAPAGVLQNLMVGLFAELPVDILALNSAHVQCFVATQISLAQLGRGAVFLSRQGQAEYAITLSEVLPGCMQVHALSSHIPEDVRTTRSGRGEVREARRQLLVALAIELIGHPNRRLIGFANLARSYVDLFIGLIARGRELGGAAPIYAEVLFHKINLNRLGACCDMGLRADTQPPGWLGPLLAARTDDVGARFALELCLDRPHAAGDLTERIFFHTEDAVLVIEQGRLGVSALGIGDRAHFFLSPRGEGAVGDPGALFARFLADGAVRAVVRRENRQFLPWFDWGKPGTAVPPEICVDEKDEAAPSTFAFVMESDRVALWLSWLRSIR